MKLKNRVIRFFKSKKGSELTDVEVDYISLVENPANEIDFIYKSASASDNTGQATSSKITFEKYDDEKGIVYGAVYSPDKVDVQGDYMTAEEIEKSCHDFSKKLNLSNVDEEHNFKKTKAFVAESFILKGDHPNYLGISEGSWVIAMKIEDDELKKSIKDGKFKGFSMAGTAIRKTATSTTNNKESTI